MRVEVELSFDTHVDPMLIYEIEDECRTLYGAESFKILPHFPPESFTAECFDEIACEAAVCGAVTNGFFSAQRVSELATYAEVLDDDSVAPKMKILEAIEHIKEEQRRIAMIEAEAQAMQQRAQQFLMGDPDEQAGQINDAQAQLEAQMQAEEAQYIEQETELDEETAEAEEETEE
jgi:CheY-like chemotaxis protein